MKLTKDTEMISVSGKLTEIDQIIEEKFNEYRKNDIFIEIDSVVDINSMNIDGEIHMIETFMINKLTPQQYINKSIFKFLEFKIIGDAICFNNIGYITDVRDSYGIDRYYTSYEIQNKYEPIVTTIINLLDSHILDIIPLEEIRKQIVEHIFNILKSCV